MRVALLLGSRYWVAACIIMAMGSSAAAMFAEQHSTPVDRMLKTAEAYLARHPNSPGAYYTLARIHYLAFHLKSNRMMAWMPGKGEDELPGGPTDWMLKDTKPLTGWRALRDKDLAIHAAKALDYFHLALRSEPPNERGAAELGIACLKEEVANWNREAKMTDLPPELMDADLSALRHAYARAFRASMPRDSQLHSLPLWGLEEILSYEAASSLVRLAREDKSTLSATERRDLQDAEKAIKRFKKLPMREVTPIVFSFCHVEHLNELLAPETTVDFDLRGYGLHERWPWVLRPELGILVWDPERTGAIESARQLFGGYSFQIFRANGYDALAALDDNGDGELTGDELDGISVWFDRNGDGVSSPEEVIPLQDLGIVSVAATMEGFDGRHPTNACGITMRDGRRLRTWDWIVEPAGKLAAPMNVK